jgi:Co/Zn/Cd efflux system component
MFAHILASLLAAATLIATAIFSIFLGKVCFFDPSPYDYHVITVSGVIALVGWIVGLAISSRLREQFLDSIVTVLFFWA